jgi:hypothetical protein
MLRGAPRLPRPLAPGGNSIPAAANSSMRRAGYRPTLARSTGSAVNRLSRQALVRSFSSHRWRMLDRSRWPAGNAARGRAWGKYRKAQGSSWRRTQSAEAPASAYGAPNICLGSNTSDQIEALHDFRINRGRIQKFCENVKAGFVQPIINIERLEICLKHTW